MNRFAFTSNSYQVWLDSFPKVPYLYIDIDRYRYTHILRHLLCFVTIKPTCTKLYSNISFYFDIHSQF